MAPSNQCALLNAQHKLFRLSINTRGEFSDRVLSPTELAPSECASNAVSEKGRKETA